MPPLFAWLRDQGHIAEKELFRVFNCGIGMAIVVGAGDVQRALRALRAAGETAWPIGRIEPRTPDGPQTIIV